MSDRKRPGLQILLASEGFRIRHSFSRTLCPITSLRLCINCGQVFSLPPAVEWGNVGKPDIAIRCNKSHVAPSTLCWWGRLFLRAQIWPKGRSRLAKSLIWIFQSVVSKLSCQLVVVLYCWNMGDTNDDNKGRSGTDAQMTEESTEMEVNMSSLSVEEFLNELESKITSSSTKTRSSLVEQLTSRQGNLAWQTVIKQIICAKTYQKHLKLFGCFLVRVLHPLFFPHLFLQSR